MIDDGSTDFSDVTSGASTYDDTSGDTYGSSSDGSSFASGSYGSPAANYGSALGGLMPTTLGGGGQGAGTTLARSGRRSKAAARAAGLYYRTSMNPLNPKALRRAISRVSRFEHFAKSVLKITSPGRHVAGVKRRTHRRRSRW